MTTVSTPLKFNEQYLDLKRLFTGLLKGQLLQHESLGFTSQKLSDWFPIGEI
nr:hypothetical protein [uncultured Prevotella sp.]